jgi:hypothetical protein
MQATADDDIFVKQRQLERAQYLDALQMAPDSYAVTDTSAGFKTRTHKSFLAAKRTYDNNGHYPCSQCCCHLRYKT